jgi:putative ABC transport system ATP-binding protein
VHHDIAIIARGLSRSFGSGEARTVAVREASLELRAGEMSLLMGPSGSGKTTLLAMLSGLLRPDSGQVIALGQDLWAMSDARREVFRLRECGFIFQGSNLMPALSAGSSGDDPALGHRRAAARGWAQGEGHA